MQKRRRPKPTPRGKGKPRRLWGPSLGTGASFSRPDGGVLWGRGVSVEPAS